MGSDLFMNPPGGRCNCTKPVEPICQMVDCFEKPKIYPMYLDKMYLNFQLCPKHKNELVEMITPHEELMGG